jgi:hypothetical protein
MISFSDVEQTTERFFQNHWPTHFGQHPSWNEAWGFEGSMQGHDQQGIYVLLGDARNVLYIGVGASLGTGRYAGHGLGSRTNRYMRTLSRKQKQYTPTSPWKERGLSEIITLGFAQEHAYLAYGLEAFLLGQLAPPHNNQRPALHR